MPSDLSLYYQPISQPRHHITIPLDPLPLHRTATPDPSHPSHPLPGAAIALSSLHPLVTPSLDHPLFSIFELPQNCPTAPDLHLHACPPSVQNPLHHRSSPSSPHLFAKPIELPLPLNAELSPFPEEPLMQEAEEAIHARSKGILTQTSQQREATHTEEAPSTQEMNFI
ncbi:hypothetical protein AAC387_Pa10g0918 [Persea americana]